MIDISDFSVTNIHIIHLPFLKLVRVTGLEPAHHGALEPKCQVTLLELSAASDISIALNDLKIVYDIWANHFIRLSPMRIKLNLKFIVNIQPFP